MLPTLVVGTCYSSCRNFKLFLLLAFFLAVKDDLSDVGFETSRVLAEKIRMTIEEL